MKLNKLSPDEAQALTNLQKNPDFVLFLNYVGNYGEDIVKALCQNPNLDNPEYHRGMAGAITEVLGSVEKAPLVVEQYKQQS